jgi:hypothetical protein
MKIKVPKDYPVRPLKRNQPAEDRATCGTCGLSWDDAIITSMTPAPAARCPFETFHDYEPPKLTAKKNRENAARRKQARKALDAYAGILGAIMRFEDDETLLCDLLADCMHLLGRETVEGRVYWAAEHYEAERRGEE